MYSILKSTFLLLLAVVLTYCDETCPAPTDIYPCKCSSSSLGLEVFCHSLAKDIGVEGLQKVLNGLSGKKLEYLDISSFNLEQAPKELLNDLTIQEARFQHTNFREMPAFKGSEDTLQKLTCLNVVSKKSVHNFTLKVSHLNKLKFLSFSMHMPYSDDTEAISVGDDWFENGPTSLEEVTMFNNNPKSLGDHVFSKLVNLKRIHLPGNNIEELHRSMFPKPAKSLLAIGLQRNRIKSLPEDIFSHMPVLEEMDVKWNLFNVLDERTWTPVWEQLDSLDFGDTETNRLACDSTISWTLNIQRPRYLHAFCDYLKSNQEYKGRSLADIIDKK